METVKRGWGWFAYCLPLLVISFMGQTLCMADTDITQMVDDAETVWTSVKGVVIGIVAFFILLAVVKLIKRR